MYQRRFIEIPDGHFLLPYNSIGFFSSSFHMYACEMCMCVCAYDVYMCVYICTCAYCVYCCTFICIFSMCACVREGFGLMLGRSLSHFTLFFEAGSFSPIQNSQLWRGSLSSLLQGFAAPALWGWNYRPATMVSHHFRGFQGSDLWFSCLCSCDYWTISPALRKDKARH